MIGHLRFALVVALLGACAVYMHLIQDVVVPTARPFQEFPLTVEGWRMARQFEMTDDVLAVLKPTDYLSRVYKGPGGEVVQLYIGYHSGGKGSGRIHSPRNCLPAGGWLEAGSSTVRMDLGGQPVQLVQTIYQKGDAAELFLYWFQVGNRIVSDEYALKLAEISNSLLYRRREASFIRISLSAGDDPAKASKVAQDFVRSFFPVIRQFLPS